MGPAFDSRLRRLTFTEDCVIDWQRVQWEFDDIVKKKKKSKLLIIPHENFCVFNFFYFHNVKQIRSFQGYEISYQNSSS